MLEQLRERCSSPHELRYLSPLTICTCLGRRVHDIGKRDRKVLKDGIVRPFKAKAVNYGVKALVPHSLQHADLPDSIRSLQALHHENIVRGRLISYDGHISAEVQFELLTEAVPWRFELDFAVEHAGTALGSFHEL
jgi:hypothetical protein